MDEIIKKSDDSDNSPNFVQLPENQIQSIMEELQVVALQRGTKGLDLAALKGEQLDKFVDLLAQTEKNAFNYHTHRLDVNRDIELRKIESTTVEQRTTRYISLAVIFLVALGTFLVLIFKDNYFTEWISVITGFAGGYGFGKLNLSINKKVVKSESGSVEESSEVD